jgi:hypothetical protein
MLMEDRSAGRPIASATLLVAQTVDKRTGMVCAGMAAVQAPRRKQEQVRRRFLNNRSGN